MKFFANESTTVGLWHFEETSGSTHSDGSGNGYTLTDVNAPTRTTTTDFGGGLSFDGTNDYTERNGGGANLEVAQPTVELLLRKPSPHSGNTDQIVSYEPRGANNDGRGWSLLINSAGKLVFMVGFGTGAWHSVTDDVVFPLDRWIYVAATYDQTTLKIYRCGTLTASAVDAGTIQYAALAGAHADTYKTFVLGAFQENNAGPNYVSFGAYEIADLRLSDIAKSDSDIFNEQRTQKYCETEPTAAAIPPPLGGFGQLPFAPYQRYKSIRAAVGQYNNLVIGP